MHLEYIVRKLMFLRTCRCTYLKLYQDSNVEYFDYHSLTYIHTCTCINKYIDNVFMI